MTQQEELERSFQAIDQIDREALDKKWPIKQVYRSLGLSRETLRYYERLQLIDPIREENQYRSFTMPMLHRLMQIDFFKKRGFRSAQLPHVMLQEDLSIIKQQFYRKQQELMREMTELQIQLERIQEDISFLDVLPQAAFQIKEKDFPLYRVLDQLSNVSDVESYHQHLLRHVTVNQRDLLNSMIREVSVDQQLGYQNSIVHIVEKAEKQEPKEQYLLHGPCLYAIVEAYSLDASKDTMKTMYYLMNDYLITHHLQMLGKVYITTRMSFMGKDQRVICYHEAYVPLLKE